MFDYDDRWSGLIKYLRQSLLLLLCLRSKNVPTLSTGNTSGTDAGEGCEERRHAARAAKRWQEHAVIRSHNINRLLRENAKSRGLELQRKKYSTLIDQPGFNWHSWLKTTFFIPFQWTRIVSRGNFPSINQTFGRFFVFKLGLRMSNDNQSTDPSSIGWGWSFFTGNTYCSTW